MWPALGRERKFTSAERKKMKPFHSRTPDTNDDWQTPLYVINALGEFDFDPCPNQREPLRCAKEACLGDGLIEPWKGRVWLNPPYGDACKDWMQKMAGHGKGIALIPPRIGSGWFHRIVFPNCSGIFAIEKRLAFISASTGQPVKGNNADSILISYGEEDAEILRNCKLPGVFLTVSGAVKINGDDLLKDF
jgi:hypothetical protein